MADFKLNQTGATIQEAIDRAIIAAVTKSLSTEEYNALTNKDPKTLYIINDDTTEDDFENRLAALESQMGNGDSGLEERVTSLESQMGDVNSLLDEINGEVI